MCGVVSFKRGDSFYRTDKVTFNYYDSGRCEADVAGKEDFHVIIERDEHGDIRTQCTCPKLSSYTKDCQHIAAVLLAIYDFQRSGTLPFIKNNTRTDSTANEALTEGLLTLFTAPAVRTSGHQFHFENREELTVVFTCEPVEAKRGTFLFAIDMKIGSSRVANIREFLQAVKESKPYSLSDFLYNPSLHCFSRETDAVIQLLIQMAADEWSYGGSFANQRAHLLIAPSAWDQFLPLLSNAPQAMLKVANLIAARFNLTDEPLPLRFQLGKTPDDRYQLDITGLHQLVIMEAYNSVITGGKVARLSKEDCGRLSELKQMLEASGGARITIAKEQLGFFLEKVVPGLRRLGEVKLSDEIVRQFGKIPLKAKLYLDRVKNRLLAGLEFHYENNVINPLEGGASAFYRDTVKENEILQLMEDSSFAKTDGGYFLHNEELEYEFLYHTVPRLEKLVQIYATTAVRNRIFRENTFPKIRVWVKKERTNWLEFKFELLGISEQEIRNILEALEEKRKYYRLKNGALYSLESREFAEINRFLHAVPAEPMDIVNGVELPMVQGLQLLDSVDDDRVLSLEQSFHQFFEELRQPKKHKYVVPDTLETILRDYQKLGFQWMKSLAAFGFGGILADDMGLGKTLQSIAFIVSELPQIRKSQRPALIACPSSLTYNWMSELLKFAPDVQAVVVDGNKTTREKLLQELTDIDVVITSYPLLRRDLRTYEGQHFHTVFFDEAQAFKNPLTQTARAVKRIKADHRFALTGTPVENSPEELWAIFYVVFPELFKGLEEYSHLTRSKIARRIRPFLLRRMKEDVLAELPEKVESAESVELLPDQKKLYAAYLAKLRQDTLKHLDKETIRKNRIKILAGLTRLRQICCHPALFVDGYKGSSAKFEQLMRIVEESRLAGRRLLIFSQFTKMLDLIGRDLTRKGLPFFYLDGQTPAEERVAICERFNRGERDIFLISLKAGGTGLNLTGADTVILYDTWWNPAVEDQAMDRAHRIGQTKVVQVIKLFARGTIEEKMNDLQEKKRHLVEEILDSGQNTEYSLTEEDIREILMY